MKTNVGVIDEEDEPSFVLASTKAQDTYKAAEALEDVLHALPEDDPRREHIAELYLQLARSVEQQLTAIEGRWGYLPMWVDQEDGL